MYLFNQTVTSEVLTTILLKLGLKKSVIIIVLLIL